MARSHLVCQITHLNCMRSMVHILIGPVVDGNFGPDIAANLLVSGRSDRSVEVMTGHNSDEGALFTDPSILDDSAYC